MAKVKKLLDLRCSEYILVDHDRVITQAKDKCNTKSVPEDFNKQFEEIVQSVKDTTYINKQAFKNVKVGEELKF